MPKRKIAPNTEHGFVGEKPKSKAKPKEFNNPQWIIDYWLHRDRIIFSSLFTSQDTKNDILKRYGKL